MKKKTIKGIAYIEYPNGVMVPASYVQDAPIKVRTPSDILPLLSPDMTERQERFIVITLDGSHNVIKKHVVTIGLANQSQIHPRETFFPAVQDQAVSIIVAHNHPSGNLEPSDSDLAATRRLVDASKTMGIPVLDHLIVIPSGSFRSLREFSPQLFT